MVCLRLRGCSGPDRERRLDRLTYRTAEFDGSWGVCPWSLSWFCCSFAVVTLGKPLPLSEPRVSPFKVGGVGLETGWHVGFVSQAKLIGCSWLFKQLSGLGRKACPSGIEGRCRHSAGRDPQAPSCADCFGLSASIYLLCHPSTSLWSPSA